MGVIEILNKLGVPGLEISMTGFSGPGFLFSGGINSAEKFGCVGEKSYLCGMNAVCGIMDREKARGMARKLYPIGIQTFSRISEEDLFYIDKTAYVYHMTHTDGVFFFLSRPRRFGKSLLVSTFHSYFEGRIDISLETKTTIYVMELKFNKSVEEALAQIEAKHYADTFKLKGKPVVKVGMNFSLKDEVNTLEWKVKNPKA